MARKIKHGTRLSGLVSAACASTLCLSAAMADDTEVFFGQVDPNLDIFPNVLFVLDTSGSMNASDGGSTTRLERMKDALDTILDNTTNVNVGVMRFNGTEGGGAVLFPITPIDKEICEQGNCGEQSAAPQTNRGENDVEEVLSSGAVSLNGNILTMGVENGNPKLVGTRFEELNIPKGATITSARIEYTAHRDSNGNADFLIEGHLHHDSPAFSGSNGAISALARTASVAWDNVDDWRQGLTYQSADMSSVLQEIVDLDDWCGGNSATFFVTGTGTRDARSYNQSASASPKLKYTYDASNLALGEGCVNQTVVAAISASTDDAEQRTVYGNTYTNSSDLELPYDRGIEQTVGLRFTDIEIPKGAEITNASIEFEVDRQRTGNLSLSIAGQSADNPPTFENKWRNITNRPKTSSVIWNNVAQPGQNSKITADGLEPIVQELVDRNGWQAGNAMVFIISKVNGKKYRELESFDGEPANAPKLRVTFKAVNDGQEPTIITARDKLKEVVNGLTATGGTPIVDAYYEAARYYRGEGVDYGRKRGKWGHRYHRVSVPDSYTGGTVVRNSSCTDDDLDSWNCYLERVENNPQYIAPFKSSCQTNHIVFLSDGAATSNSASQKVKSMIGMGSGDSCGNNRSAEHCGEELATWLNDTDHSNQFNGKQNISTYTIGFNFSSNFLKDIASAGGGSYFQASSSSQLVDVFQSILGDVLSVDTSFVAPGATVNQFNRLTHRSDIYFALFKPDKRPTWVGNLKKYEVKEVDGKVTIIDAQKLPAVDTASGFFKDTSESHWLENPNITGVDGNQVAKGGAAMKLEFDSSPRNIFTYVGDYPVATGGVTLKQPQHKLHEDNTAITLDDLGIANSPGTNADRIGYRNSLLKWARGVDVQDADEDNDTTDWRQHMGDPMHARPVILNYASGTAGNPAETLVFVGTNEGYLHAFENQYGTEEFSFVPKELLPNFDTFWNNQSTDDHPYGLDGTLSIWTTDTNENVTVDPGEKAFLYTGMRRGGDKYYAFDVSDKSNPKLAWVIEAGTTGFEELGQTWSKMTPARIRFNGEERDVLIFGAGYHDNQDWSTDPNNNHATIPRSHDSRGRGIYIVDAEKGTLIYSALATGGSQNFADMKYSMPSNLRILDADFDGFADQIYASDTGGRVWRFDLEQYHDGGDLLKGGIMADLSGGGLAGERRFYYEPDVAMISNDGDRFLSISIGSGWRAHPLDLATDDRFYMIKSPHLFSAPPGYGKSTDGGTTYQPITEADLVDVTNDLDAPLNAFGWKYDLGATGEKVLGNSITVNNQVIFSTYRPALSVGACTTAIGGGSVYALNILNGGPAVDMNGDGVLDENDREKQLAHGGIPPEPALLITESGPTLLAGPEQPFEPSMKNLTRRTFWVDRGDE